MAKVDPRLLRDQSRWLASLASWITADAAPEMRVSRVASGWSISAEELAAAVRERHDARQLLAALVLELPPVLREAILVHHDSEAPTVRMLAALERLRADLDRAHAGDRRAWTAKLTALTRVIGCRGR